MKPYLIHYGFELHPKTEEIDNEVNKYMKAYKGTSRNSAEIIPDCFGQVRYSIDQHSPKDDRLVIF